MRADKGFYVTLSSSRDSDNSFQKRYQKREAGRIFVGSGTENVMLFYHCILVLQYRVILVLILACLETSLAGWVALIELCPLPARESSYKVQHPETICSRQKTGNKAQAHNFISQSNLEETYVSVCEFNFHKTPRWLYVSYSYRLFTICVWISFQVTKQKYFVQLMPTQF